MEYIFSLFLLKSAGKKKQVEMTEQRYITSAVCTQASSAYDLEKYKNFGLVPATPRRWPSQPSIFGRFLQFWPYLCHFLPEIYVLRLVLKGFIGEKTSLNWS
jgi:hypothetical protein